jgi:hypothetical protein
MTNREKANHGKDNQDARVAHQLRQVQRREERSLAKVDASLPKTTILERASRG